jgi:hypothetical protein
MIGDRVYKMTQSDVTHFLTLRESFNLLNLLIKSFFFLSVAKVKPLIPWAAPLAGLEILYIEACNFAAPILFYFT